VVEIEHPSTARVHVRVYHMISWHRLSSEPTAKSPNSAHMSGWRESSAGRFAGNCLPTITRPCSVQVKQNRYSGAVYPLFDLKVCDIEQYL